jgi:hypothetical protein
VSRDGVTEFAWSDHGIDGADFDSALDRVDGVELGGHGGQLLGTDGDAGRGQFGGQFGLLLRLGGSCGESFEPGDAGVSGGAGVDLPGEDDRGGGGAADDGTGDPEPRSGAGSCRGKHDYVWPAAPSLRPLPDGVTDLDHFRVRRRDRAGGVIHEYRLVE